MVKFNAREHHNRESDFYFQIRYITANPLPFNKDLRTSAGRKVSAKEMRYRRVYGHAVVDQMIESGCLEV